MLKDFKMTFAPDNKNRIKNRIEISPQHKKQLVSEFKKSKQTIQMSLDFVFNSETAVKIRQRAAELMQLEILKIEPKEKNK